MFVPNSRTQHHITNTKLQIIGRWQLESTLAIIKKAVCAEIRSKRDDLIVVSTHRSAFKIITVSAVTNCQGWRAGGNVSAALRNCTIFGPLFRSYFAGNSFLGADCQTVDPLKGSATCFNIQ